MHGERTVLTATLGYNLAAPEFEVSGQGHRIAHDGEGVVLVKVWGGCRLGILCLESSAPSASRWSTFWSVSPARQHSVLWLFSQAASGNIDQLFPLNLGNVELGLKCLKHG
jgi:hypothetical protein